MPLNWTSDVEPVLDSAYRLLSESSNHQVEGEAIAADLASGDGRVYKDEATVYAVLRTLGTTRWLAVDLASWAPGAPRWVEPTEKGLQRYMGWPET